MWSLRPSPAGPVSPATSVSCPFRPSTFKRRSRPGRDLHLSTFNFQLWTSEPFFLPLLPLFAPRVLSNSFPINRFRTLSYKCRGVPFFFFKNLHQYLLSL